MALLSPRFPPAALALHQLGEAEDVTDAECACLVQCLWGLAREMVPGEVADGRVLESSRTFLSWLVSRASASRGDAQRERSRELAIKKKQLGPANAAAAAAAEGGVSIGVVFRILGFLAICGCPRFVVLFPAHAFAAPAQDASLVTLLRVRRLFW